MKVRMVILATLLLALATSVAFAQHDGVATGPGNQGHTEVSGPPPGQMTGSMPAEEVAGQPETAPVPGTGSGGQEMTPRHQTREGHDEAAQQVLGGAFAPREHRHPQSERRTRTVRETRYVTAPASPVNVNVTTPPAQVRLIYPPAPQPATTVAQTTPPAVAAEGEKGMNLQVLVACLFGAIAIAGIGIGYYAAANGRRLEELRLNNQTLAQNNRAQTIARIPSNIPAGATVRWSSSDWTGGGHSSVEIDTRPQGPVVQALPPATPGVVITAAGLAQVFALPAQPTAQPLPPAQPGQAAAAVQQPPAPPAANGGGQAIDPAAAAAAGAAA